MITRLSHATIVSHGQKMQGLSVYLAGGKIIALTQDDLPCTREIDLGGLYLSPGWIDLHVHGGGGSDFMDDDPQAALRACELHLHHGTTTLYPTTLAGSMERTYRALCHIRRAAASKGPHPHIPGVHLEGPYFSQKQSGAQNPAYIKPPCPQEYQGLFLRFGSFLRRWSFAPELDGAMEFCRWLSAHNILPSIGHSDAQLCHVEEALAQGCRLVTHLYSGMSTITRQGGYRRLGVVESALLLDDFFVELIADGRHLPPELVRLVWKIKGPDRICLVTDAMRGAGMPDGPSHLGPIDEGMDCIIEDAVAKLPDRSAFAGSVATADRLVRICTKEAKIPLEQSVQMMTQTPAAIMGLEGKGKIEVGYDADLVVFDSDIHVHQVFLSGNPLFPPPLEG